MLVRDHWGLLFSRAPGARWGRPPDQASTWLACRPFFARTCVARRTTPRRASWRASGSRAVLLPRIRGPGVPASRPGPACGTVPQKRRPPPERQTPSRGWPSLMGPRQGRSSRGHWPVAEHTILGLNSTACLRQATMATDDQPFAPGTGLRTEPSRPRRGSAGGLFQVLARLSPGRPSVANGGPPGSCRSPGTRSPGPAQSLP